MKIYVVEDFRPDCEHGVVGVYRSLHGAKQVIIQILQEEIESRKEEIGECLYYHEEGDEEYAAELIKANEEDEEAIEKINEHWKDADHVYLSYNSLYITSMTLSE